MRSLVAGSIYQSMLYVIGEAQLNLFKVKNEHTRIPMNSVAFLNGDIYNIFSLMVVKPIKIGGLIPSG
jgi:hypothetical protein